MVPRGEEASGILGPSQELLAWAKNQGVDLIHIKLKTPGSDKWHYAFLPIDMKVWRIENGRYENLVKELRTGKKLELPTPSLWRESISSGQARPDWS